MSAGTLSVTGSGTATATATAGRCGSSAACPKEASSTAWASAPEDEKAKDELQVAEIIPGSNAVFMLNVRCLYSVDVTSGRSRSYKAGG